MQSADGATLTLLARRHRATLLRYFFRRGLSESDSEDAAQEVFARLARRTGLAEIERLEGYLFETAANVAIDLHRQRAVRRADTQEAYDDGIHGGPGLTPEDLRAGREGLDLLIVGLKELPERTRHVFVLARLENMKHAEIARRLEISVSAVEKNLVRAFAHLGARVGRTL